MEGFTINIEVASVKKGQNTNFREIIKGIITETRKKFQWNENKIGDTKILDFLLWAKK
jgi:hypothetical protein